MHSGLLIDHTDRRSGRHPGAAGGYCMSGVWLGLLAAS